jgi:hypothetical protein
MIYKLILGLVAMVALVVFISLMGRSSGWRQLQRRFRVAASPQATSLEGYRA